MRIVSLIPSATEIVCGLGLGDSLVGRSHECDFPDAVRALPIVSQPSYPVAGTSSAINLAIKERQRKALSIYTVNSEALRRLRPDVIITQSQCEVCAVSLADVERAVCDLVDRGVEIVDLRPLRLSDIWTDIRKIAVALGCDDRGGALVAELRARMAAVSQRVEAEPRKTFVTIEWIEPLMTAGNWMPELVELAGGDHLLAEVGKHSPWITWQQLQTADPDVLLVSPCGFTIDQTLGEMHSLSEREGWSELRAVTTGQVYVADGNAYFHRPGPRLADSLEILAEILHPARFDESDRGQRYRSIG